MSKPFHLVLGAFICSQFFFSCQQSTETEEQSILSLCEECGDVSFDVVEPSISDHESITIHLDSSLAPINTNIPLKIEGNTGYLITKAQQILSFSMSEFLSNNQVTAQFIYQLPNEYCVGIADYYINNPHDIWIITRKDHNFIYSFNPKENTVATILNGDKFLWNAYPFLGATVARGSKNEFYLPIVTGNKTETALFSSFRYKKDSLTLTHEYGIFDDDFSVWEPYGHTPYFANFNNGEFWTCGSTSQAIAHYKIEKDELVYLDQVCFPSVDFTKNLPFELQNDQGLVSEKHVVGTYNMRIMGNEDYLLKFVKEPQDYIDSETRMKRTLNDSPWFIDYYTHQTKAIKRIAIPAESVFFTLTFLDGNELFIADQHSEPHTVQFNRIRL